MIHKPYNIILYQPVYVHVSLNSGKTQLRWQLTLLVIENTVYFVTVPIVCNVLCQYISHTCTPLLCILMWGLLASAAGITLFIYLTGMLTRPVLNIWLKTFLWPSQTTPPIPNLIFRIKQHAKMRFLLLETAWSSQYVKSTCTCIGLYSYCLIDLVLYSTMWLILLIPPICMVH